MADVTATNETQRRRRIISTTLWCLAAIAAAVQLWGALARPAAERLTDLHIYIGSAGMLRDGASLYDFVGRDGAPFTYPPFAGLAFAALTLADEGVAQVLWTVATVGVVVYLAVLVRRWSPAGGRIHSWMLAPLAAGVLFLSAPVSSNLRFGQVSVFLGTLVLADVCAIRSKRWSGVASGISAAVKLTPLIFIPMYWLSGRWRAAMVASLSFIACGLLGLLALPRDSARFWLHEVMNVNRIGNIQTSGNQSLNGALIRLSIDDPFRSGVVLAVAAAVGAAALLRARRAARADDWFTAVTIVGAASIVMSPVSWTHHQIWLVLAAFLAPFNHRRGDVAWLVGVALVMTVPLTSIAAGLPGVLGAVLGNCRLLLAFGVACLIPVGRSLGPGNHPEMASETASGVVDSGGVPSQRARLWSGRAKDHADGEISLSAVQP